MKVEVALGSTGHLSPQQQSLLEGQKLLGGKGRERGSVAHRCPISPPRRVVYWCAHGAASCLLGAFWGPAGYGWGKKGISMESPFTEQSCSSQEQVYFGGLCMQEGSRGPEERLFLQAKALEESLLHATSKSWTGVCLTVPRPARGTGPPLP